ncbi:MAG: LysR family transcriptional regulator [Pseudomonadota bacterium]|jgi:DNA-binding transcriptional LysR family regulator
MHYDLTDLRLFLNVGEALHLTRAAERSFLSPSAASMRIKQLEEALRTPLLIRQAKGLQLTRAGEIVLEHARAVFRQLDCLHADLLPYAEGVKGSIRLMANSTATNTFLADALSPFLREHAAIDIELTECSSEEVMASVVKGVADLGVIAAHVQSDELEVLPLYPDELVLIASQDAAPALPDRTRLSEVLDGFSFVGLNQFNSIQTFVDRIAQSQGKRVNLRIQVSSFDAVCQMVIAGAGIAVVPRACATRYDGNRRLRLVELADPWARRQMSLVRPRRRTLPAYTEQLIRHLVEAGTALRER